MDDAVRVREGDRLADAKEDAELLGEAAARRHPAIEAIAADPLHRVEQPAVRQLAEIVDRHDAGVLEPGEDARLVGVLRQALDDLEGDLAVQHRVAREVDDAHAAAAEDGDQLVARAGDVGPLEHRRQAIERRFGDHPVNARDSAANSSSVAHCSRSTSSTCRRNSRRAAASSLVTSPGERPSRRASSA